MYNNTDEGSDLLGFDFDTDEGFENAFGIKDAEAAKVKKSTSATNVVSTIKGGKVHGDMSDFEEDGDDKKTKLDGKVDKKPVEATPLERPKAKADVKEPVKVKVKAEVVDEEDITEFDDFEEEKIKTKEKETKKEKEEEDDDPDDPEVEDDFYTGLALDLKEKGIFQNIKLEKNKVLTEDEFFELHEQELDSRVDEVFEGFFEALDNDGKDYLKWKKNGGDTRIFLTKYLAPTFDLESFDEDNKNQVERVIDHYLRVTEKLDEDELADRKKFIEESGKSKAKAKSYFNILKKSDDDRKKAMMKAVEDRVKQTDADAKQFSAEVEDALKEAEQIGSWSITAKDKKELNPYITKPTVKTGKNTFLPPFEAELHRILNPKTDKDMNDLLLLAKMVKNKFSTEDLATKVETEKTREIKSRIKRTGVKPTSGTASKARSLADVFPD